MCGRYFIKLEDSIEYEEINKQIKEKKLTNFASEEVFPSQRALLLVFENNKIEVDIKKWGLDMPKGILINARAESMREKYTFKQMLDNRCVIIANGFYEWVKSGTKKDKVYIQKANEKIIYLAGIYNKNEQFVILTGESDQEMKNIHNRTPLILRKNEVEPYLKGELEAFVDCDNLTFMKVEK